MPPVRRLRALPIAPRVPIIPAVDRVFHPCVVAQRMSNDLIIYSRDVGRVITIAYPLGPQGVRIVPRGLFDWMSRRGLVFECFCALVSGQLTPARFVSEYLSGDVVVRCNKHENRCGFYLNLTNICAMTPLESTYSNIPTLQYGDPDIELLLQEWRLGVQADLTVLQSQAPFIEGYFGIHTSIYPNAVQLRSGLALYSPSRRTYQHHRTSTMISDARMSLLEATPSRSTRQHIPIGPVAGPSRRINNIRAVSEEVDLGNDERDILTNLRHGVGVNRIMMDGSMEECDGCGRIFMATVLREHIKASDGHCGGQ